MTDKVDTWIWIWDNELQRKKKIRLQTLLNRINHTLRHENQTYFALEKQRDKFREECKSAIITGVMAQVAIPIVHYQECEVVKVIRY